MRNEVDTDRLWIEIWGSILDSGDAAGPILLLYKLSFKIKRPLEMNQKLQMIYYMHELGIYFSKCSNTITKSFAFPQRVSHVIITFLFK